MCVAHLLIKLRTGKFFGLLGLSSDMVPYKNINTAPQLTSLEVTSGAETKNVLETPPRLREIDPMPEHYQLLVMANTASI